MYRLEKVITSIVTSTFKPDWVSPLSDTIADLLEEKDWTKTQLAGLKQKLSPNEPQTSFVSSKNV